MKLRFWGRKEEEKKDRWTDKDEKILCELIDLYKGCKGKVPFSRDLLYYFLKPLYFKKKGIRASDWELEEMLDILEGKFKPYE